MRLSTPAADTTEAAEYARRRERVFARIGNGTAVLIGAPEPEHSVRFRQNPDLYYLTGVEEAGAVLVLQGRSRTAVVYVPPRPPGRIAMEGPGLLEQPARIAELGLDVRSVAALMAGLRSAVASEDTLFLLLSGRDDGHLGRGEVKMHAAMSRQHPLLGGDTPHERAMARVRELRGDRVVADIVPFLDSLRWIKSPWEVARLRTSGRIAAEALTDAIRRTRPDMYEYELEAIVTATATRHGARDIFLPIVASGPNTTILHYTANDRRMRSGELVYIDYGADYRYYASDVTRVWPVSGRFTPEQQQWYDCVLAVRDAVLAAMKPGVTLGELQNVAEAVYARHGFRDAFVQGGRYLGHPVGLSVHDPLPSTPLGAVRLQPGAVFNLEPVLHLPARGVHLRLEDTILITADGAENLTAGVPADVQSLYELLTPGANR